MIIDAYYESVISKLTSQGRIKEISAQLLQLNTNSERVLFVYKIFEDLNCFPIVQEVKKSDEASVHYRNLGNTSFKQCKYHKALQYYNLSLVNAILYSESYFLALSNRSAVFYELELYNECLQDVNKVLSLECPEKIQEKLTKRKKMCCEALSKKLNTQENHELNDLLKMESTRDSRYLCASSKLDVVYSNEMGRHVIAKEDIKVGEVLVQEEPYFILLLKSQFLCACSYCLSQAKNLLPCESCCRSLYCSIECKEKAWNEYHSIECVLMATLFDMDFTKLEWLALRTVIKARQEHNNWESFFKTIKDADDNYNSEFRGHVKINDKWVYDSKHYASIHTLATNIEKRSISDIFQKCVTAVVFLRFLEIHTTFLHTDFVSEKEDIRSTVAGLLLLHLMTSPTNMHGISVNSENSEGNFVDEVSLASAPYAFLSLLNHSCAPNVVRFSKLGCGKMSLFAIRPIKKGMQIFDNYGSHHALEDIMARQASLKFQYKFTCMCEACINNWPTYMQLHFNIIKVPAKLSRSKDRLLTQDVIGKLQKGDITTAIQIYKRLCILCAMLEPYAPCVQLCDCQESLKQCLAIFEGVSHGGSVQLIDCKILQRKVDSTDDLSCFMKGVFEKMNLQ